MSTRTTGWMLLVGPAIAVLVGCGGGDLGSQVRADDEVLVLQVPPDERETVQPFEAADLDGDAVDESLLAGQVTVVNVWGSWCAPCREEAPALRRVAAQYDGRGVGFLGLNVREDDSSARAFERRFRIPYPSVRSDDSPRVALAFGGRLSTTAVPMTVVVDDRGRVAATVVGKVTEATLRGLLDDLLDEPAPPASLEE
ncbi:MAG: TlpA disulfide reductase family protein [Propionibacteriaceae bacterium]